MTEEECDPWTATGIAEFAADKQQALGITPEAALALSRQSYDDLLPQGLKTPDAHILVALNKDGEVVGSVWFNITGAHGKRQCFVLDLVVRVEHRRRGYGLAIMQSLDALAANFGATSIGLHVFGHNGAAAELYRKAGFQVTDMTMVREVTK